MNQDDLPEPVVRPGRWWKVRHLLGGWFLRLSWLCSDPHDSWMIDYRNERGHLCGCIRKGSYSMARAAARELKGRIVGWHAAEIPA